MGAGGAPDGDGSRATPALKVAKPIAKSPGPTTPRAPGGKSDRDRADRDRGDRRERERERDRGDRGGERDGRRERERDGRRDRDRDRDRDDRRDRDRNRDDRRDGDRDDRRRDGDRDRGGGSGKRPASSRDGAPADAAGASGKRAAGDGGAREGATAAPPASTAAAAAAAAATDAGSGGGAPPAPFPRLPLTGDKMRDKVRGLIASALFKDTDGLVADKAGAEPAAAAVEAAMFAATGTDVGGAYKSKYRQLSFNLKDAKNVALRTRVLHGDLTPAVLVGMSNEELANEETKAYRKEVAETMLREAQPGGNARATTDMFRCGKCKQRRTTYHQMQTRSADEPMTTFVCCLECGNRWKC